MADFWGKFKKNILESFNEAIDKTEELTSVGKIKMEILHIEHHLDEKYAELGKYVYEKFDTGAKRLALDETISRIQKEIDELQTVLLKKEKDLVKIREEDGVDFD